MLKKLFGSKKYTSWDLLNELLNATFDESKLNTILNSGLNLKWTNDKSESYLHICAMENKPSSIQWLLKKGMDINILTGEQQTPLFYAVIHGSYEATELLISKDAKLDHLNNRSRTVLQEAVKYNRKDIIGLLINQVDYINNIDDSGHNIIFDAIETGDKNTIAFVSKQKNLDLNCKDLTGNSVLFSSIVANDISLAMLLISNGADASVKNSKGKDFIFYSLEKELLSKELLQEVIGLGYDINVKCLGKTLVMAVCEILTTIPLDELEQRTPYVELLELLIFRGALIDEVDSFGENILFIAVRNNDLESVKLILSKKAININHKNNEGNTVLVIAALKGDEYIPLIIYLLSYSANPNVADNQKATLVEKLIDVILYTKNNKKLSPLFLKQINREAEYLSVFKTILENSKVFLRKLNSQGKPLFFEAIFYQNDMLFKLLRNHGADINHKDSEGKSILHNLLMMSDSPLLRNEKKFTKILRELIFYGADVNSKDATGSTTVHNAILNNNINTVKVLLDSKADMKSVDKKGRSLVHNCVWDAKIKHFRLVHSYNENILNVPDQYGILPINYAAFIGHADLVLEMITARSHVNNPHKKDQAMVDFFKKFYENVYSLSQKTQDDFEKKNIRMLIANMEKEFGLSKNYK